MSAFTQSPPRRFRDRFAFPGIIACGLLLIAPIGWTSVGWAQGPVPDDAPISRTESDRTDPANRAVSRDRIDIIARTASEWTQNGHSYALLDGGCRITQGMIQLTAPNMILEHTAEPNGTDRLRVYAEGGVQVTRGEQITQTDRLMILLATTEGMRIGSPDREMLETAPNVPLVQRFSDALGTLAKTGESNSTPTKANRTETPIVTAAGSSSGEDRGALRQVQGNQPIIVPPAPAAPGGGPSLPLTGPGPLPPQGPQIGLPGNRPPLGGDGVRAVPFAVPQGDFRRVRIFPRSTVPFNVLSVESTNSTPPEQILVISGGVQVLIDGLPTPEGLQSIVGAQSGTVDLSADRVVIWTGALGDGSLQTETVQLREMPFEVYLEGNIVLRQGNTVIRATHAVYNDRDHRALMLNADLRTRLTEFDAQVRIRAERLRQLSLDRYHAQNAFTTTSTFGEPGYRLQSTDVFLEQRPREPWFGLVRTTDPETGEPLSPNVNWITALNNRFVVGETPLFGLPVISGPAEDPNIPLRRASAGQDNIFGFRFETTWDLGQLLGADLPQGVELDLHLNQYSDRGPGAGLGSRYIGSNLFEAGDLYRGENLIQYQYDGGTDNLGLDRRDLSTENNRGRVFAKHRHLFPDDDLTFIGSIGFLSDRNYLEQYYEPEFNNGVDNETSAWLEQDIENLSWSVFGRARVNDFTTTTNWLPRADVTLLSERLGNTPFTWSQRTSVGIGQIRPGERPLDPAETFDPLPYYSHVGGGVYMTRHELDMPFQLGPVNFVPYVRGSAAHWDEDLTASSLDRVVGTAGVRSSLQFWRIYPEVRSRLWGLNGLNHKVELYSDYSYTDSSQSIRGVPQYNEFDDNAQERFRQRFVDNTFGGLLPDEVAPRRYAIRYGAGDWVSVPYHELVDDLHVLRFGVRQRFQTKVGPPTRPRIRDWLIVDAGASFFPNEDEDNFGEPLGLIGGNFTWNVGSRSSFVGGMLYDLFDNGQNSWNVGFLTRRSRRGRLYLGLRHEEAGRLNSTIATASYSYLMSPKWSSTLGAAFDVAEGEARGQSLTLTRIGADFLFHTGVTYDPSKDNFGFAVMIEPKFFGRFDPVSVRGNALAGGL